MRRFLKDETGGGWSLMILILLPLLIFGLYVNRREQGEYLYFREKHNDISKEIASYLVLQLETIDYPLMSDVMVGEPMLYDICYVESDTLQNNLKNYFETYFMAPNVEVDLDENPVWQYDGEVPVDGLNYHRLSHYKNRTFLYFRIEPTSTHENKGTHDNLAEMRSWFSNNKMRFGSIDGNGNYVFDSSKKDVLVKEILETYDPYFVVEGFVEYYGLFYNDSSRDAFFRTHYTSPIFYKKASCGRI